MNPMSPIAVSLPEPGKAKNQAYQASATVGPKADPVHILAVADGVSSSPLAAQASRVACEEIVARVAAAAPLRDTAVRAACGGKGLASLVAAVLRPAEETLFVASFGDSGIYLSEPGGFRLLNQPDRAVRVRKEGGRIVIRDGVPVIERGLTLALGAHDAIRVQGSRVEPWPKGPAWLCLTSDGVSWPHLKVFLEGLQQTGRPLDERSLSEFADAMRRYSADDTTLLVLKIA